MTALHKCLAVISFLAITLTGCGQTGPLYLPEDKPNTAQPTAVKEPVSADHQESHDQDQ